MNTEEKLKFYYTRQSELYQLECIMALLGWDQQVYMPPYAAKARANQIEHIGLSTHQKSTDPEFIRVVDELNEIRDTLSEADQTNIRETKRLLDIERKLPDDFVSEMHQASTLAYSAWAEARPADDFKTMQPYLEKLVDLSRRMCDLIGYQDHPYDALLDQYEPGMKTATVKPLLLDLADKLREIIPAITQKFEGQKALQGNYPEAAQLKLCKRVAENMGFSFKSGRIDTTAHPFMTTLGPKDFRITTRFDESDFISALYSTIHETGHALYELGLPEEYAGTPAGSAVSLGIHESQSRLWENLVGRSTEFCSYLSDIIPEYFPGEAKRLNTENLWKLANRVQPTLIRTEADEVTYSQHIVIRMMLELSLVTGDLKVADLPEAWNDLYEKYLGIRPDNNRDGVLQDVHWYSGSIGYFPTYALGNLFNAMMMESIREAVPDLSAQIRNGDFSGLLNWLREHVHRHGMRYRSTELIQKVTGKELGTESFIKYLKQKYLA